MAEQRAPGATKRDRLALAKVVVLGGTDEPTGAIVEAASGAFPQTLALSAKQFLEHAQAEIASAGSRSPRFWQTTRASLSNAIRQAAGEGLLPGLDGWFVPFGQEIVWMRNHKGVMKLVRRAGTLDDDIKVQAVLAGDPFVYRETAAGTTFEWEPGSSRGPVEHHGSGEASSVTGIVGVWLRAYPRGSQRPLIVYLPWEEIDARRKASIKRNKKESSPWQEWTVEMAMKTVILYAVNRGMLPLNTEIQDALNRVMRDEWGAQYDEQQPRYLRPRRASEVVDVEPDDDGESEAVEDEPETETAGVEG